MNFAECVTVRSCLALQGTTSHQDSQFNDDEDVKNG